MVQLALELGRNEGKELVYNVEVWKHKAIGRILTTSSEGQEDRKLRSSSQAEKRDRRAYSRDMAFQHGGKLKKRVGASPQLVKSFLPMPSLKQSCLHLAL